MKNKILPLVVLMTMIMINSLYSDDWIKCSSGLETAGGINVLVTKGNKIFAGTGSGMYLPTEKKGIFVSSDNGDSWQAINNGVEGIGINRLLVSNTIIYAGTDNGVYKSTNDGANWIAINIGLKVPISGFAKIGNTLFASTFESGVYKSLDDGVSWSQTISGMTEMNAMCLASKGNDLYCGTMLGGLYYSGDMGTNWVQKNEGLINTRVFALLFNGNDMYAGSYDGGVYYSSNDGNSWELRNEGFGERMDAWSFAVNEDIIYTGINGYGVYYSSNKGQNWISSLHIWEDFHALSLTVNNNYIFCGFTNGSIYKMKPPGSSNINLSQNQACTIYPNPTCDYITIKDFFGDAKIYNILGTEVWNGFVTEGMRIDISNFSEGVYFVRFGNEVVSFSVSS